jgi:hypothetical protein
MRRRRSFLTLAVTSAGTSLLVAGCYHPGLRPPAPQQKVGPVPRAVVESPAPVEPASVDEVAFYDLTEAYGLKVAIDMVTGRRVCQDGVNTVIVMPSARVLTVNGVDYALHASIRWKNGALVLPGESRAILAERLQSVPIPEVDDPTGLDGRDEALPASARRKPRTGESERVVGAGPLPSGWRVKGERSWKYIVIHHSATPNGDAASFGREHQRKWPNGLGYHFVIGNGTGSGDGEIEVGPRWKRQGDGIDGAHAGNKLYNQQGIGICLVGDFEHAEPTPKQLAALRTLCRALMGRYGITRDHVQRHCEVRVGHTDCPGKGFPYRKFVSGL